MIYVKLHASLLKPVIWKRSLYESFVWKISIVIIIIIILYSYFYFILRSRRLPGISSVTFTQSKTISLPTYFITLCTCSIYATSLLLPLKPCSLHKKRFINFHLDAFVSFLSFMFSSGFSPLFWRQLLIFHHRTQNCYVLSFMYRTGSTKQCPWQTQIICLSLRNNIMMDFITSLPLSPILLHAHIITSSAICLSSPSSSFYYVSIIIINFIITLQLSQILLCANHYRQYCYVPIFVISFTRCLSLSPILLYP